MDVLLARKRVRFWKRRFSLDWTIRVRLAKTGEISDKYADCHVLGNYGVACIVIHEKQPYAEFWIVHEVLHIVLAGLTGQEIIEERAIHRLCCEICRTHKIPCPSAQFLLKNAE